MRSDSELAGELTLLIFRLNGQFLAAGEQMARPVGLTVARWQVLGAVLREPGTASDIARRMGLSRQSVQRLVNALMSENLLVSRDNPAHKRAPLIEPTQAGRDAVGRIAPHQVDFAGRLIAATGRDHVQSLHDGLAALSKVLEEVQP